MTRCVHLLAAGWALAAIVVAVALGAPGRATAQRRGKGHPKVIQLQEIKIEGRVQKPNAFYILNRSNLGYKVMDLRTSFVDQIVRSVQKDPF